MGERLSGETIIAALETSALEFIQPLRMNEGFKEEAYQRLLKCLAEFEEEWADSPDIPKAVAMLLVDIEGAMDSCTSLYSEVVADRIVVAKDLLDQRIRDVLCGGVEVEI